MYETAPPQTDETPSRIRSLTSSFGAKLSEVAQKLELRERVVRSVKTVGTEALVGAGIVKAGEEGMRLNHEGLAIAIAAPSEAARSGLESAATAVRSQAKTEAIDMAHAAVNMAFVEGPNNDGVAPSPDGQAPNLTVVPNEGPAVAEQVVIRN